MVPNVTCYNYTQVIFHGIQRKKKSTLSITEVHFVQESKAHIQEHEVKLPTGLGYQFPSPEGRASAYQKFGGVIRKL